MTTTAESLPSFRDDLRQVVKTAGVVATVLSMLSLGLPAVLAWITERLGPAIPIWKAFVLTAPLTIAVAVVVTGILRGWLDGLFQLLFATASVIVLTSGIAHLFGMPGWIDLTQHWRELPSGIVQLPIAVASLFLQNYWRIYGPQQFASSLVVGVFLAWAWGAKILPHLDRLSRSTADDSEPKPVIEKRAA